MQEVQAKRGFSLNHLFDGASLTGVVLRHNSPHFNRKLFVTTLTLLNAIAASAD